MFPEYYLNEGVDMHARVAGCVHCKKESQQCVCPVQGPIEPPLTWKTMNRRQKFLTGLGYFFASIIAIGSGVSTAAAFVTLNLVSAGLASYIIAGLIFSAGTLMNWYINKNAVPEVLVDIFGKGKLFQGLMEVAKGQPLSKNRKRAMWFGFLLALSVGITNGVLTYASTFSLSTAFGFLAAISPAFPPIAGVLAGVTLICLTALMLKNIAAVIKTKNLKESCLNFLRNLVSTDPSLPHNQGKSRRRIVAERITTTLLTMVALPLAGLGLYMTMNACAAGAKTFLLKNIPKASVLAVEIVSKTISLGFALLGRIPFTFKNTLRIISRLFPEKAAQPAGEALPSQIKPPKVSLAAQALYVLKAVALYTLCVVNAVGNGLISIVGGGGPERVESMLAGVGGTWNSFVAGASNINLASPSTSPLPPPPKLPFVKEPAVLESSASQSLPRPIVAASSSRFDSSPSSVSLGQNNFTLYSPSQGLCRSDSSQKSDLERRSPLTSWPDPLLEPGRGNLAIEVF
jgi:hypothetical protein